MTEFDENGVAVPGTYAIAVTHIAGSKIDGTPVAVIESAVCDVCGNWASDMCVSGEKRTLTDDVLDIRISRRVQVIAYVCPDPAHREQIIEELVNEYGHASNYYPDDKLADAVARAAR